MSEQEQETVVRYCANCGTDLPLEPCEHDCATGEVQIVGE